MICYVLVCIYMYSIHWFSVAWVYLFMFMKRWHWERMSLQSVSEVFVVTTSVARAAELPVAQRPSSLIPSLVPGALTTRNLVADPLLLCIPGWLCIIIRSQEQGNIAMTAASGQLNQALHFNWNLSLHILPPLSDFFLPSLVPGFTSCEPMGQRLVCLPGLHSNSRQHQMSSELANHD